MSVSRIRRIKSFLAACVRKVVEEPVYSAGILAYSSAVRLVSFKNRKARLMCSGHKEIWSRLDECVGAGDRYIWIHAASLGEFEQGRPLIERIKRENPEYKVLLTFFSPSGYEVRKNYKEADCVIYLPFDTPRNVRKFIDKVKPEMVFFVKYEFWRNYLHELHRRNIPVYLISGIFREGQYFFRKSSSWYGHWLRWFTKIYVQDFKSRSLLQGIGVENVDVAGDTRFDRVSDIRANRRSIPVVERFAGEKDSRDGFVMVAGSSWQQDEAVYFPWLRSRGEVKAIIAPHEFDADRLRKLKDMLPEDTVLYSEAEKDLSLLDGKRVLVVDTFGMLSSIYHYGDFAYVGGGFGDGLHNINEAAVYGIPVVYGPNNAKFIEAQEMKALGAGIEVHGEEGFTANADRLLFNRAECRQRGKWAEEYIQEKIGATDKIYRDLFKK